MLREIRQGKKLKKYRNGEGGYYLYRMARKDLKEVRE